MVQGLASQPALHKEGPLLLLCHQSCDYLLSPIPPKEAERTSRLSYTTVDVLSAPCPAQSSGDVGMWAARAVSRRV